MNTQKSPCQPSKTRRRGYSLIELLVVISIIAILASIAFSATRAVLAHAYKVETKSQLVALEVAVQSYLTEYNRLPGSGTSDETLRLNQGTDVLKQLLGEASGTNQVNRAGVSFLQVKMARSGKSGLLEHGDGYLSLVDHWGNPLFLVLDSDLDGRISNPDRINEDSRVSSAGPSMLRTRAAAFSAGPDGKSGTHDDIVSWR